MRVVILVLTFSLGTTLLLSRTLNSFDQNDFFYATASKRQGVLYQDLHYVQAPLGYWFWRGVYLVAPEGHAYATMRLASAVAVLASLIPILALFRGRLLAQLAFLLAAFSTFYVLRAGLEIATYSLALFFSAIGISALASRSRHSLLLAGLAFGIAASFKLNSLLMAALLLLVAFLDDRNTRSRTTRVSAASIGFLVGALPLIWYGIKNPWAFYFHNLAFHSELINAARGLTTESSIENIASGLYRFFSHYWGEVVVLTIVTIGVSVSHLLAKTKGTRVPWLATQPATRRPFLLLMAGFVLSIGMAVSPRVLFDQYLALSALLLVAMAVMSSCLLRPPAGHLVCVLLIGLSLVRVPDLVSLAWNNFHTERLSVLRQHSMVSRAIEQAAREHPTAKGCVDSVFTLSGSFIVDTSLPLARYTEAGPFWAGLDRSVPDRYRSDPSYGFDGNLTKPLTFVAKEKIGYVLVGASPHESFEREFVEASESLGFHRVAVGDFLGRSMQLFIRGDC